MNSSEIVAAFRSSIGDKTRPYLWDDSLVFSYLDDAQDRFCRETDGLADARTPEVSRLAVTPGQDWISLHPKLLNIRRATRSDTGREIRVLTAEQAQAFGVTFLPTVTGIPSVLVLGLEENSARLAPMPHSVNRTTLTTTAIAAINTRVLTFASTQGTHIGQSASSLVAGIPANTVVDALTATTITLSAPLTVALPASTAVNFDLTLNLSTYRRPLVAITDEGDQELEIDSQHHLYLLHWMKYHALNKQDTEVYNAEAAEIEQSKFLAYCGKVKAEQARKRRAFGTIVYGGL